MSKNPSTTLALAAAALFLGGCSKQSTDTGTAVPDQAAAKADPNQKMKCFGANECAAQAACDVPDGRVGPGSVGHACGGQNECKGKGWILLTQAECDEAGGEPL